MSEDIAIRLSRDEAPVLFEFFSRFADCDNFTLRHNAEYLSFSQLSAQLDKILIEPLRPEYAELLRAARERIAASYEALAPGLRMLTPDHALQRTAIGHCGCNRRVSCPPSLSLGRKPQRSYAVQHTAHKEESHHDHTLAQSS